MAAEWAGGLSTSQMLVSRVSTDVPSCLIGLKPQQPPVLSDGGVTAGVVQVAVLLSLSISLDVWMPCGHGSENLGSLSKGSCLSGQSY